MNSNLKHLRDKLQSLHLSTEQYEEVLAMIEEACEIGIEEACEIGIEEGYEIGIEEGYDKGYVKGEIEANYYNSL